MDIARWIGGRALRDRGQRAGISLVCGSDYAQSLRSRQEIAGGIGGAGGLANVFSDHSSLTALGLIWIGPDPAGDVLFLAGAMGFHPHPPGIAAACVLFRRMGHTGLSCSLFRDCRALCARCPQHRSRRRSAGSSERGLQCCAALHGGPMMRILKNDRPSSVVRPQPGLGSSPTTIPQPLLGRSASPKHANPPAAKARARRL